MLDFFVLLYEQFPFGMLWSIIANGGWIVIVILVFFGARTVWLIWRQNVFESKQKFVLLAIDIPQIHAQSPRAVEHIFSALWGLFSGANKIEKWWQGKFQLPHSLELISIEGYTQFLVRTPAAFRDLVESAIYAQYPDSEITEVEDYVDNVPKNYPNETHELWGTEFRLVKPTFYPIKTYPQFEYSSADVDKQFADPIAGVLEVMSKIGPGEQMWLQWVITPLTDDWQKGGLKEAAKLAGKKVSPDKNPLSIILSPFAVIFSELGNIISAGLGETSLSIFSDAPPQKNDIPSLMQHLTPGERSIVEEIQKKCTKIGFQTKMRFIYSGEREVFNKPRGVAPVIGALRQYAALDLNAFRPDAKVMTKANYFRVKQREDARKNKVLSAYRARSQTRGAGKGFILNTEELASVWHFPTEYVRAPQVKRSETKRVEPPASLPTERRLRGIHEVPQVSLEGLSSFPVQSERAFDETGDRAFDGDQPPEVVLESPEPSSVTTGSASAPEKPPGNLPVG